MKQKVELSEELKKKIVRELLERYKRVELEIEKINEEIKELKFKKKKLKEMDS